MKSVTKAAARFKLPESQKLEERHVVGRDVYGGKHAYGVEFFDRDGNGRADAARVTGEVTRPGFNQPLSTLSDGPVTTVYLFDEATGLPTDRLQTGGGRSEKVSQFEWRDGKGVERTTADANQDGRVDEALEADVKPRMSLLGLRALDAAFAKHGLTPDQSRSKIAHGSDWNLDGRLSGWEVAGERRRLDGADRRDKTKRQAVVARLVTGFAE